jgi:hypothetical protein
MIKILSTINNKVKQLSFCARREAVLYKNPALCLLERAMAIPAQPSLVFLYKIASKW